MQDNLTDYERKLTDRLKKARGNRFGQILKQTYCVIGVQLAKEARSIKAASGKLSIADIAQLAVKYNLGLKHTFDFLEDPLDQVLPFGTYDVLLSRGLKPKKIMENANARV
jgi:hypothetical protein